MIYGAVAPRWVHVPAQSPCPCLSHDVLTSFCGGQLHTLEWLGRRGMKQRLRCSILPSKSRTVIGFQENRATTSGSQFRYRLLGLVSGLVLPIINQISACPDVLGTMSDLPIVSDEVTMNSRKWIPKLAGDLAIIAIGRLAGNLAPVWGTISIETSVRLPLAPLRRDGRTSPDRSRRRRVRGSLQ
jgi:hypothetical protein